jgi:hypothetical protein
MNDAEQATVLGNRQRRTAILGDFIGNGLELARGVAVDGRLQRANRIAAGNGLRRAAADIIEDRINGTLADG